VADAAPPKPTETEVNSRVSDLVQHVLLGEAIDEGPSLVFVADDEGRYVAVNKRACEALGYTRAEILGKRVTEVAVADDAPGLYEAMLRDGSASGVTQIRCKDGRLLSLRYRAAQVIVARVPFWVSIGAIDP
jgi:PAS domain S-box-containing protein